MSIFDEYKKRMSPTPAPPIDIEVRVVKTDNVITQQSDKLRATKILWTGSGYGHIKGADRKNALKMIKLFCDVWHFRPEEVMILFEKK